ncbi:MAG: 1-deoxy-D-xylulose-5-phosphate synthase [Christensenellales bacterium]|jgi:1-deoxy-D-xylulose-5-phosphate synthase
MLGTLKSPKDLHAMSNKQLKLLAQEIRTCIMHTVTENGGHLSSNLGTVDLTVALYSVFDAPEDKIVFDVGHQAYAHKLLTGRYGFFSTLRKKGGISGFPRASESEYDAFTAGHASTSISAALGMARARDLMGDKYHVVAVIGDGALTGGMSYEALNDAGQSKMPLIVILNDNAMSISKNVGALSTYLTLLRQSCLYMGMKQGVRGAMGHLPLVGGGILRTLRKLRDMIKRLFVDDRYFTALGFTYLGPVNGHDIKKLKKVLQRAKRFRVPVLIHVATQKGKGFSAAEKSPDAYHGVSVDTIDGNDRPSVRTFGRAMAEELIDMAQSDIRVTAVTAAMPQGTGLDAFQAQFPDRFFDVGIAEEHAVTMAAGMAFMGMRPYVALYSTFSQRAFDQMLMDVCLPNLPVTLLIDRAGLVGEDGATHQGAFDLSMLRMMPNMIIASPRDVRDLKRLLHLSCRVASPMAIRYGKEAGDMGASMEETEPLKVGEWELLLSGNDVTVLAVGRMVEKALAAAIELNGKGISCGVVDARFVKPMDDHMLREVLSSGTLVVTMEENVESGGFGAGVLEKNALWKTGAQVFVIALPDRFIEHASVSEQAEELGFMPVQLAQTIQNRLKAGA